MTDQNTEKKKRVIPPLSEVKASIEKSVDFVLTHPHLNPSNLNYIKQMEARLHNNKQLTSLQVQGLSKIEGALKHVDKGSYKSGKEV